MLLLAGCLFFWMICGHAIADYCLQTDWIARGKSWINNPDGKMGEPWWRIMAAHALCHGGITGLLTGWVVIGVVETVLHYAIDCAKVRGDINGHVDQALHALCKLIYAMILAFIMTGGEL